MFKTLLARWRGPHGAGADAAPDPRAHLGSLVPIILPSACLDGWPGPIERIGTLPFAVAWATQPKPNLFHYVTHEEAERWRGLGIDWPREAMRNLERLTAPRRWAGEKCDRTGRPFLLSLLFEDAFGPSRLLLPHLYDDVLGAGYRVAIPEQTCAIAYRAELSTDERADVDGVVEGCFRHGTEPMSAQRFDPSHFWIFGDRQHGPGREGD
jgi:hypothetical protein